MGHRAQFIGSLPLPLKQLAGLHYDKYMAQHAGDPARQAFALTLPDVLTYGGGAAFLAALARRGLYRTPELAAKSKMIVGGVGLAAALIAAAYHTPALQDAKRLQRRDVLQHVMNSLILKHADAVDPKKAIELANKVAASTQAPKAPAATTATTALPVKGGGAPMVPKRPSPVGRAALFISGPSPWATVLRGGLGYGMARILGGSNALGLGTAVTAASLPWIVPQWQRVHKFVAQSNLLNKDKAWNALRTGLRALLTKNISDMDPLTQNTWSALTTPRGSAPTVNSEQSSEKNKESNKYDDVGMRLTT